MAIFAPIDPILLRPSDHPHLLHLPPHPFCRPLSNPLPRFLPSSPSRRSPFSISCTSSGSPLPPDGNSHNDGGDVNPVDDEAADVDQAFRLDGQIPATSDGFVKQITSRAYRMRRRLEQTIDSTSYDVLESNPWIENSKPVYVLAQEENKLLTMRTRRVRSEVENELNLLFPRANGRRGSRGILQPASSPSKGSVTLESNRFSMIVEDVREGVLVFEDEEEATKYCNLLDDQGKGCMGVAELDASDVFALCRNIKAFAVLFRRGRTPPLPERLQMNLKARDRSLED